MTMCTMKLKNIKAGLTKTLLMAFLMLFAGITVWAQETKVLTGKVVDPEGNPIPGAIVNISESSSIVLTNVDGVFSLKDVKATDEIIVTSVGYMTTTVKADFSDNFTIAVDQDLDRYAHTTAVPFGRKKLRNVTEAISVVTGEELERHPITVLQNAFTSTVTGMQTYEWSSEPGWSETAMYIRGLRTMNTGARAPLVIVDNVERDLSFLDAYPIETITILKDAAASAIYGMRGANGVVLVTTKRGQAGKTNINFTQEFGFQTLTGLVENQNSYNMALTRNQISYLDGKDPIFTDEDIEYYRRVSNGETLEGMARYKYFNTNWNEELFREAAPQLKTNLSMSGGNDRARYFLSFSYLRQEGMWNNKWTEYNDGFSTQHTLDRYNLRSNIDIDVSKFLNVSLDLGGRIDNISQPRTGVFSLVTFGSIEATPMKPVYTPNGELFVDTDASNAGVMLASSGMDKNRRRNLYTTITATGDLSPMLRGLKADVTVSFDSYETFQSVQTSDVNAFYYNLFDDVNDVSEYAYTRKRTFSALSNPSAVPRDYYYNINMNSGLKYAQAFGVHDVSARAFVRTYQNVIRGHQSSNRYLSFNGQVNYVYDNRYILSGNISHMGCDNFAPEERFATFPGGSVGWILSEESWLKNNSIDLLKLRASYGRAGQSITGGGRYPYQSTFAQGNGYNFGTSQSAIQGTYESAAGNSNNKWEISDMVNVGIDFDFMNRKIYGSVDAFKEWRSNILVSRSTVPLMLGVNAPRDSYGKAESKGFELTLGHRNKIGELSYYAEGMLTWNTNKITEMDELEPNVPWQRRTGGRIFDYSILDDGPFDNNVGGYELFLFEKWASDKSLVPTSHQDAIDNPEKYPYHSAAGTGQPLGTAVFKDLNGDRLIDSNDKTPYGYTVIPEVVPSLNIGFEIYGIDARMIMTAYMNRSVMTRENIAYSAWGKMGTHEVVHAWGYYTDDPTDPRNINAKYPRPSTNSFSGIESSGDYQKNTIWLFNGNFLSLRNIELGYSLPIRLISKINMTKCRLYFSGYNLHTWSHLPDGFDPEKPMSYVWWYPKTRSFSVGVNVGF